MEVYISIYDSIEFAIKVKWDQIKGSAVSYHPTKPIEQRQGLKNTRIISTEYFF